MDSKKDILNTLLVELFNNIMTIEEKVLHSDKFDDLSLTEFHVIAAIGVENMLKMSDIASKLGVTVGTLTIAINNLLKKEYVVRSRSETDRRVVYVTLTDKGHAAYDHHETFHQEMIEFVLNTLNETESEVLTKSLFKIIRYFKTKYES
ncbi:MarR family winged helix-turn-helix transcriptional regulator [Fusibacter sp. 3D3]|uniref:MarR family winged helix-turn-helix transcriptional regulator n=1 Tax=Fusibacter sp. 3D3 TaxID=1048380 RepID=UPI0008535416|nr:MarR family transcriptional regulator [Fusibacter sp. 3D3]GAU77926.1 transcriptional regulator of fatty acid biosynthesis FabT [Fusibacter sp. 3D3]